MSFTAAESAVQLAMGLRPEAVLSLRDSVDQVVTAHGVSSADLLGVMEQAGRDALRAGFGVADVASLAGELLLEAAPVADTGAALASLVNTLGGQNLSASQAALLEGVGVVVSDMAAGMQVDAVGVMADTLGAMAGLSQAQIDSLLGAAEAVIAGPVLGKAGQLDTVFAVGALPAAPIAAYDTQAFDYSAATAQQAALGDFIFSIHQDTAYQALTRTSDGGWVSTDRAGKAPGSQNTGPGLDTIQIRGAVLGSKGQSVLDRLRALQATREPQAYVDGAGNYLGLWKIMRITEGQKRLVDDGNSLQTEFSVELESYKP